MYVYGAANTDGHETGSLACHAYPVTQSILQGWFDDAGLVVEKWVRIRYKFLVDIGSIGGWGAQLKATPFDTESKAEL